MVNALDSLGYEMAGDIIDSHDVTDVYKSNGYVFFEGCNKLSVEESLIESSSDEVKIGRVDPGSSQPCWLTAKKLPSGKYSIKEYSPMGVFSVGTYTTLDPEKILRTYEKDPNINRRPEVDWDYDAIEKLKVMKESLNGDNDLKQACWSLVNSVDSPDEYKVVVRDLSKYKFKEVCSEVWDDGAPVMKKFRSLSRSKRLVGEQPVVVRRTPGPHGFVAVYAPVLVDGKIVWYYAR